MCIAYSSLHGRFKAETEKTIADIKQQRMAAKASTKVTLACQIAELKRTPRQILSSGADTRPLTFSSVYACVRTCACVYVCVRVCARVSMCRSFLHTYARAKGTLTRAYKHTQ